MEEEEEEEEEGRGGKTVGKRMVNESKRHLRRSYKTRKES